MHCTVCRDTISDARLEAMPGTTKCIECAAADDVPMIRRFDDHTGVNESTECYFIENSMIESEIERLRITNPFIRSRGYEAVEQGDEGYTEDEAITFEAETPFHYMQPVDWTESNILPR